MLQGKSWEKGGVNPLDNLKAKELRDEITARGRDAGHCTKPQLQKIFNEMRNGIANVPALLQVKPREELNPMGLIGTFVPHLRGTDSMPCVLYNSRCVRLALRTSSLPSAPAIQLLEYKFTIVNC